MHRISPKLYVGLLLTGFFALSFCIRVCYPFDQVFTGEWIKFTSIDAYYHMRIVDSLVHNFPHALSFDPYFIYPGGEMIVVRFFDWFLALIIWVIGLGSPTQHMIDVISALYPSMLAAITVIPVFFIGKALYNRWTGVIAAGLIAVLPGEYMGRSILGFTDHHVAEVLLSATAILFLILAVKTAREKSLTFAHIKQRDWQVITRPLVYSLLAGFFLGLYHLTWGGGLLFAFIIALYIVIQFIIDHVKKVNTDYLCISGVSIFLVALIVFIPLWEERIVTISLFLGILMALALWGISRWMGRKNIRRGYYPLVLVGAGVVVMVAFFLISPDTVKGMLSLFSIFAPQGETAVTTLEMQPFLSPQGSFSLSIAWGNFTTCFYVSLVVLIFLVFYKAIYRKHTSSEENLFIIWCVVIFAATLGQRRFAYYFAANVALLSAYFCWQVIWYAGLRRLVVRDKEELKEALPQAAGLKEKRSQKRGIAIYQANVILAIIVVFFFAFFPNIVKAKEVASSARFAPTDAWQESLTWMKDNTPEPFDNPSAYYQLHDMPPGQSYTYPASVYGVTSWWDYGYWITRTAHRIPSANPSQAAEPIKKVANFFLSGDEESALKIARELDSSYVIIDYMTCTSKFWAMVTWSGRELEEFVDIYHVLYEGELVGIRLYYPEYYHTMVVRLYNFGGQAMPGEHPIVITYEEKTDLNGNRYKEITDFQEFATYQEALIYFESQESDNCRIVGVNPFMSPVPLEEVSDYRLVHDSKIKVKNPDVDPIPEVRVFEYTGN